MLNKFHIENADEIYEDREREEKIESFMNKEMLRTLPTNSQ